MPVVRRGDADGVNVLVLEKFSDVHVAVDLRGLGAELVHVRAEDFLVHVAHGGESHTFVLHLRVALDVRLPAAIDAYNGDVDRLAGAFGLRDGGERHAERGAGGHAGLDEVATTE
jgi:hypothetical protein